MYGKEYLGIQDNDIAYSYELVRGEDKTQNTFSVWKKRNVEISALYKFFASLYIDIRVNDTAFF